MKRQRGRHSGRKPHHHQPHNPNLPIRSQTFDSNGPDVRVRGNAFQILEKYVALARDAHASGDRIAAENYYQHAEHYYRLINESGGYQQQRQNQGQGQFGQDGRFGQGGEGQGAGQHGGGGQHPMQGQGAPQGATVTPTGYAAAAAAAPANADDQLD